MISDLTAKKGVYGILTLVLVGGSVLMLVAFVPHLGGTPEASHEIDSCTTIDQPGRYELTKDIMNSSDDCIRISASNVILDGQGHTIDGTGNGTGVDVDPPSGLIADLFSKNAMNVTVKNMKITDCFIGISYTWATDSQITDTNISSNQIGISIQWVKNSTISNNTVSSSELDGILLLQSTEIMVSNNTLSSNRMGGIRSTLVDTAMISNNTALSNNLGIMMERSKETTISNNTVSSNNHTGIGSDNSDTISISNNTVLSNDRGIFVRHSEAATVSTNTVTDNRVGIDIHNSSATVVENGLTGNTESGVEIDDRSKNRTVSENTLDTVDNDLWLQ